MENHLLGESLFSVTREIGIDMGHRVTYHGSKCRNIHGHRYTIQATCIGTLYESGESEGMVMDFGFLKEEMISVIHNPCDHGFCLWVDDKPLMDALGPVSMSDPMGHDFWSVQVRNNIDNIGFACVSGIDGTKLYIVPFVPTAENLAAHWYGRLSLIIKARTDGHAKLSHIKVWETPNCSAQYPPPLLQ